MLVRSILIMIVCCLCSSPATAADHPALFRCGTHAPSVTPATVRRPAETGGIYLPAAGVLRVLIVFVSFPDDETPHPYWPAHQPPDSMHRFIDPDTITHSTNAFNLTNYFRQMSLGAFHVIGDAVWVETAHSREEYRNSGSYGAANMAVLPEKVDPLVDFSRYDNWTRSGDYSHVNAPDSIVDMVIMVWRTTMWGYLGEASLGYKPAIPADGKWIAMGYPAFYPQPVGSGVTCEYPYGDTPTHVMRTMVHEMSHWLLGIFHPYNGSKPDGKFQYWGMLCNGERVSSCANTYDREQLGWIAPAVLHSGSTVQLADFVTTGAAGKFHPPSGEPGEYIYLENHQGLSVFDDVTLNPADRGVWVLHQQGPYVEMDNIRIRPADGDWRWKVEKGGAPCYGATVPVFSRGEPDVSAGLSHRDQIPTPSSLVIGWWHTGTMLARSTVELTSVVKDFVVPLTPPTRSSPPPVTRRHTPGHALPPDLHSKSPGCRMVSRHVRWQMTLSRFPRHADIWVHRPPVRCRARTHLPGDRNGMQANPWRATSSGRSSSGRWVQTAGGQRCMPEACSPGPIRP